MKQNCVHSWTYLRDYTGMQGQQHIKFLYKVYTLEWHLYVISMDGEWRVK